MTPNEILALIWGTTELVLLYSVLNESVVVFDGFDTVFVQKLYKKFVFDKICLHFCSGMFSG